MTLLTDEIRTHIGREVVYTANEEVGRAAIRYFARAMGDDNPLYRDPAYARDHGFDDVVAPPTFVCESNQFVELPPDPDGYAGHTWGLPVDHLAAIRGGNAYEFHRHLRPDDLVTTTWRLVDITERTTSAGEAMLVVTSEVTYTDASGEPIARNTETLIYKERK
ncbi:MAG TPA: MaoC family dehydratase N-terminal domain-containing protein [Actinomycetota bacterium]|nr:MaoC family dehydratase N-terminal domain-containing protein [Actinomycetota bacterium]